MTRGPRPRIRGVARARRRPPGRWRRSPSSSWRSTCSGPRRRRRRWIHRTSSRKRPPPGSSTSTTATSRTSSAAASPRSTATTTRRPDLYFAGGTNPAALYRNESPVGGALRFAQVPDPATDLTRVVGAYPLDIDGDGSGRPGRPAVRRERAAAWPGRLPLRARERGMGLRRRRRLDHGVQRQVGGLGDAAHPRVRQLPRPEPRPTGRDRCADNVLVRPERTAARPTPSRSRSRPAWCTLSILFSDWDRSGRGDLRMTNDRHYYLDGEEQLWRVAEGEPPRLYTHEEGWQQMQIWGMGIASYDVTGDGLPEVFLTSQGDNKLQTLADGAAQPNYRDIALADAACTAHRPYAGGDVLPSTAWHAEFQDVNNDGARRPLRHQGQRRGDAGLRGEGSEQPAAGPTRTGRSARAARPPASSSFARGRGAAVVDLNLDGMLDLVRGEPARERQPLAERRVGETPRSRRRWVTGSRCGSSNRVPTVTRSDPGSRSGSATGRSDAR